MHLSIRRYGMQELHILLYNCCIMNPVRRRYNSILSVTRSLIPLGLELRGVTGVSCLVLV